MLTKEQYKRLKPQIIEYEKEQLRLCRISGSTECPFHSGSKITPFVRQGKSQECKECDKNGRIKNRRLVELDLI